MEQLNKSLPTLRTIGRVVKDLIRSDLNYVLVQATDMLAHIPTKIIGHLPEFQTQEHFPLDMEIAQNLHSNLKRLKGPVSMKFTAGRRPEKSCHVHEYIFYPDSGWIFLDPETHLESNALTRPSVLNFAVYKTDEGKPIYIHGRIKWPKSTNVLEARRETISLTSKSADEMKMKYKSSVQKLIVVEGDNSYYFGPAVSTKRLRRANSIPATDLLEEADAILQTYISQQDIKTVRFTHPFKPSVNISTKSIYSTPYEVL